ncbi:hypothetical protein GCM10023339_66160 [Alloalcanivorax gelatiniphagus]
MVPPQAAAAPKLAPAMTTTSTAKITALKICARIKPQNSVLRARSSKLATVLPFVAADAAGACQEKVAGTP